MRGVKQITGLFIRHLFVFAGAVLLAALWFASNHLATAQAPSPQVRGPFVDPIVQPKLQDGDLRRLPRVALQGPPRIFPLRGRIPAGPTPLPNQTPGLSSRTLPALPAIPGPGGSFEGITFTSAGWPPDPNGDVGPNDYVQAVNISFAVYAKNGSLLAGPTTFDSLWAGANSGTACDNQNRGDPVALYDPLANRWLLADFAFSLDLFGNMQGPFYECIAISKSGDPVSGGWYRYPVLADSNLLDDYPKFGVWPDGYYMTANMYDLSTNAVNVRVWALDRSAMISGTGASSIHFDLPTCAGTDATCAFFSLLPSNWRGTLPPTGSPNYLANIETANTVSGLPFSSSVVHLWQFHMDWTHPLSSTLAGPANLNVQSFTQPLANANGTLSMALVPQPGTTMQLDTLGDRLMMQAQYRNLPTLNTQELWVAHSVKSGNVTGIRWYEIGIVGNGFVLNQQGTFDPGDGNFRWNPSLAVDGNGNMAVGYSVSGTNTYPGIRYAGRLRTDPLNQLAQGEATLIDGSGSQTIASRWGDYSAMTVDPADDTTFWYTNEYYTSVGLGLLWQTRIGSFHVVTLPLRYYFLPRMSKGF